MRSCDNIAPRQRYKAGGKRGPKSVLVVDRAAIAGGYACSFLIEQVVGKILEELLERTDVTVVVSNAF